MFKGVCEAADRAGARRSRRSSSASLIWSAARSPRPRRAHPLRGRSPDARGHRARVPAGARRRRRALRADLGARLPVLDQGGEHVGASRPSIHPPAANTVGVVTTPARTPDWKSRLTRAWTASLRRSDSKRSRSSPSARARSHRCGSSSRPWSANSESCISQKRPWRRPPRPRRRPATRADGWSGREDGGTPAAAGVPAIRASARRRTGTRSRRTRSPARRPAGPRT